MILIEQTDTFQVQPYIYIERQDILILKNIYQKMIGKNAIRLYLYLNSIRKIESYGTLSMELEMALPVVVDCLKNLEKVNLIRTFQSNRNIIHLVLKPELLSKLKQNPIYIETFNPSEIQVHTEMINTNEITEVVQVNKKEEVKIGLEDIIEYLKNNNIKQKRNIIREVEIALDLYPVEEIVCIECLERARYFDFVDIDLFKKEIRKEYSKIMQFTNETYEIQKNNIKEIEEEHQVSKQLESRFNNEFEQQMEQLLNDNEEAENLKPEPEVVEDTTNLEEIKHKLLVKEYESTPIYKYLELRLGYQPTISELKKLEQLSNTYLIPTSVINVLIDYAVFHKIGINFKYFEAVLKDWYNNKIFTVQDAIFYLRSLDVLKSEERKKTTPKDQNINWQEWYDSIKVSPNNMRYSDEEGWE